MNRIHRVTSSALRATRPSTQTASAFPSQPSWSHPAAAHSIAHSSRFPISDVRSFSSSSSALASEAPQNPFGGSDGPQGGHFDIPLFDQLQKHPEVMAAIEALAKLTAEKTGVDLQAGHRPSMSMMATLARDPELRAAAERLMAALKTAGITVDPKQAYEALKSMGLGQGQGEGTGPFGGFGGFSNPFGGKKGGDGGEQK